MRHRAPRTKTHRIAAAAVLAASVAVLAVTPTAAPAQAPTALRVMTVGDSLTGGYGSSDGQGYRTHLGELLTAAGTTPTWAVRANAPIGTMTVQDIRAGIDAWITADRPDVILLNIGTNNASGQKTGMTGVETAIHDLLNRITVDAPDADVFVATVQYSSATWSVNEPYINQYVIQASWEHPGHVYLASLDVIPVCGWLFDNIHPHDLGYRAYANQWYRAMAPVLDLPGIPTDAFPTPARRPGFNRPAVMAC